jgi:hypothetical protein
MLLLGVITYHGFQIVVHEDDPQRGGAFAMFATVDIGATRKVLATTGDGEVMIELPNSLSKSHSSLLDRPTEAAAVHLAMSLQKLTWSIEEGTATSGGTESLPQVRVQVVGLDGDGQALVRQVLVDVLVGEPS